MKITCKHPSSSFGVPVILTDDGGEVEDYTAGLHAVLERLQWSREEFAKKCGYKGARSVEKFFQGTTPSAASLNVLGLALEELPRTKKPKRQS